jgi:hypothetical protein
MNTAVTFEAEKNRKAFIYTVIICVALLLLFFIIKWKPGLVAPPHMPEDLIEINLGNDHEGFGETQPLIKGSMSVTHEETVRARETAAKDNDQQVQPDNNTDKDAAPIDQTENKKNKSVNLEKPTPKKTKTPLNTPPIIIPKPQKPLITYNGPAAKGKGNNATQDNDQFGQGNNPNGKGDLGSPNGNPDSYGNSLNGRIGNGPMVINGDRTILHNNYVFPGDLDKATIYALIKVAEDGTGSFVDFGKNSTSRNHAYATAISEYLHHMKFNSSDHESNVTVQFNFTVK